MSIGLRIKELRKNMLKLSQTEFAAPLGLTQAAIGAYENELRNVSEPSILSICREYGVREEWLRDGTGEVFASSQVPPSIVSGLAQEYDLDLMDEALISEYLKLDKQSRSVLKNYIKKVFLAADEDLTIEKEVEAYRHELLLEKKAEEKSAASGTINAKES